MSGRPLQAWVGPGLSLLLLALVGGAVAWYAPPHIRIVSPVDLALSVLLLSLGMLCQYALWHLLVVVVSGGATLRATFCSHALMIWSKYVPGKIWSIVGRAGFLARHARRPLPRLVGASTGAQVIMLVSGLGCGLSFLALAGPYTTVLSGLRLELVLLVAAVAAAVLVGYLYRRVDDGRRSGGRLLLAVLVATAAWVAWGSGLAHLVDALGLDGDYRRDIGIFATAASAGILAVVAPGGLGVREGALSVLLSMYGMAAGSAALVALLARLWFAFGELLLFLAGLALWRGRERQPS